MRTTLRTLTARPLCTKKWVSLPPPWRVRRSPSLARCQRALPSSKIRLYRAVAALYFGKTSHQDAPKVIETKVGQTRLSTGNSSQHRRGNLRRRTALLMRSAEWACRRSRSRFNSKTGQITTLCCSALHASTLRLTSWLWLIVPPTDRSQLWAEGSKRKRRTCLRTSLRHGKQRDVGVERDRSYQPRRLRVKGHGHYG